VTPAPERTIAPAPSFTARPAEPPIAARPAEPTFPPVERTTVLEIMPAIGAVAQPPEPEPARPAPDLRAGNGPASAGSAGTIERSIGPSLTLESSAGGVSRSTRGEETRSGRGSSRADAEPRPSIGATREAPKEAPGGGSNAGKLRMTVDGEHLYAEIKGGKIVLKDRTYDSLAHARDSIRRERNKVAVWEYFDEGVKAWRVLNRD
jgi:hypothetical protein